MHELRSERDSAAEHHLRRLVPNCCFFNAREKQKGNADDIFVYLRRNNNDGRKIMMEPHVEES